MNKNSKFFNKYEEIKNKDIEPFDYINMYKKKIMFNSK